ncbi:MAG: hypothetical protein ABI700_02710 [Chloroflexota bacterium]
MMSEHGEWIQQATELAHIKHYDEAREQALRVIREDGRNVSALWLVACVTNSLNERRNALRALLRIQPGNESARQMLSATEREFQVPGSPNSNINVAHAKTSKVIRSIKPDEAG